MDQTTSFTGKDTIGVDLGDRRSRFVRIDAVGRELDEGSLPTTQVAFQKAFGGHGPSRFIIETGSHSPWVVRVLMDLGHEVIVANPRKVRAIYASERKNDRNDAKLLARIGRFDPKLLHPVQHRGAKAQAHLAILKSRRSLVEQRTAIVQHVRGLVKSWGARISNCDTEVFHRQAAEEVPEELRPALIPMLGILSSLTREIRRYDRQVKKLCDESYSETLVLQEIRGVGPITALAYVLTLERVERFRRSRSVGAYLGLVPRQRQSGEHNPRLRITKAGDSMLRTLLVQCAHYILGPFGEDCDLRRFGERLIARGGARARQQAVIAVARKLSTVLHSLWRARQHYDPLRNANREVAQMN